MSLSLQAKSELQWWIQNLESTYNLISHAQPQYQITTDASSLGWVGGGGADFAGVSSGGNWTHLESKYYINYLEMLAIFLGLKTFAKDETYTHSRVLANL